MKTKIIWIAGIALIISGAAGYMLTANKAAAPTIPDSASQGNPSQGEAASVSSAEPVATVTLTAAGFAPSTITINVGDTVRFINESSRGMWVGSDEHPTHIEYDGTTTREHCADGKNTNGTFDECSAAGTGDSWEYSFEKAGTFGYHNHVGASNSGTIVVN